MSQLVPVGQMFQLSDHLCESPLDPFLQIHVLLVLGALTSGNTSALAGSYKDRVEGQNHLPRPADQISLDATQNLLGFLGFKRILSDHAEFVINRHLQVPFLKLFSIQPVSVLWIALQNLAVAQLIFKRLTWVHHSSQSRSAWMASLPSFSSTHHTA